ncbi:MAG: YggS family pyridoxal phosphate-dependent enzyme [Candidatus Marinimicrobia bacterium]|nr:YggS family pyridoxal phosphate-dependent enzyme [Candidatus Neomarinimicrobiota bacterium]|tara:strand:- start:43 stop:738 length:696 start_codon:yes stop_codon:yes gene_type:complete
MDKKARPLISITALKKVRKTIEKESTPGTTPKIIAVTKTRPIEAVEAAIKENLFIIGENKVQEAEEKFLNNEKTREKVELHLIGSLQSNKIKRAISLFDVIQTVDSVKLLKKINNQAEKIKKIQKVFIQINIGYDKNKRGFNSKEVFEACKEAKKLKNIEVKGLMTILPFGKTKKENKRLFTETKTIQEQIEKNHIISCKETSMGMSGDYVEALKSGATFIRIGSAFFGPR